MRNGKKNVHFLVLAQTPALVSRTLQIKSLSEKNKNSQRKVFFSRLALKIKKSNRNAGNGIKNLWL